MIRTSNCICKVCGTSMYRRPSQITSSNVYCSRQCTGIDQQRPKVCKICTKKYTGNKVTCSRSCSNRARAGISYTKENKFNKAYKGAFLKEKVAKNNGGVCERCAEDNYAILQVHHKQERHKGGSDALSNLEILCPNCHATHHQGRSLYKEKKMI